jgi:multiple sugar transport system permease protein
MATTAASQAATPVPPSLDGRGLGEQAYEAARARRKLVLQIVLHVLCVVAGVWLARWKLWDEKHQKFPAPDVMLQGQVIGAAVGAVLGAILVWLTPRLAQDKRSAPFVFVSPFFILFLTFGVFPILFSLYLAFMNWDPTTGLSGMTFAHFEQPESLPWLSIPSNFYFAATDPLFLNKAVKNTFYIAVVSGVPQHLVGMPLAYFFHIAYKRLRNVVTGAYFLPFITSSVAISLIFSSLFSQHFGVINAAIDSLAQIPGLGWLPHGTEGHIYWLGKAPYVKPAISFVVFWRYLGWNTVLYLSALQAISNDLFEAAEMDGASRWQVFSKVVVPLLRPMMFFAITLTIIGNLQLFDEPLIITGTPSGGPEYSGMTAAMFMYKYMTEFEYGTACAITWILFVAIALITWANQAIFSRLRGSEVA